MSDRWSYLRLFHEPGDADVILTSLVASTSQALLDEESIDRFFFLRYFEGGLHLRYRLRVTDAARLQPITRQLLARARETTEISRVETAPYEPEVRKHGGAAGQELAERQFFASSRLALSCIEATAGDPERRALLAACANDVLLGHAGLDREARRRCTLDYARHFGDLLAHAGEELAVAPPSAADVELVRAHFDAPDPERRVPWVAMRPDAVRWLDAVVEDMAALRDLHRSGTLGVPLRVVLWNLMHTFANRLGLDIASEIAIARLSSVVNALPSRPSPPAAIRTDRPDRLWHEIARGLSLGRPTAVALEGEATPILAQWRGAAEAMNVRWLEGPCEDMDESRPFGLWRRLAAGLRPRGAEHLDRDLELARRPWSDPQCPMLPDPFGVHEAIGARLLPPSAFPTIAVLRRVAEASPDCLDALCTIVRRSTPGLPVVLVVADADPAELDEGPRRRWAQLLRRLRSACGLHHLELPRGGRPARRVVSVPSPEARAQAGLALCKAGALHGGVQSIATAIAEDERLGEDPELLVHLAMATLALQRDDLATEAAEAAYQVGPSDHRQRARRVWMAALHRRHDLEGLDRLYEGVRSDLERTPSRPPPPWLLLDAALCTSLHPDRRQEHIAYLDAILARPPSEVPTQCLAVAHIWRAAPAFVEGRIAEAVPHQAAGVRLLETLADPTRLLVTRLRLGGSLSLLGRFDEATPHLEQAAASALRRGELELATSAARRAVLCHLHAGRPDAAAALLHSVKATTRHMWRESPSVTLWCETMLALARGENDRAHAIAQVLSDMPRDGDEEASLLDPPLAPPPTRAEPSR